MSGLSHPRGGARVLHCVARGPLDGIRQPLAQGHLVGEQWTLWSSLACWAAAMINFVPSSGVHQIVLRLIVLPFVPASND